MQPTNPGKRVLFALQIVGHPRDSKRIAMLQNEGFEVSAVAFERGFQKGREPSCAVEVLGHIDHGRYLARLVKMVLAAPALRAAIARNDVIYASGPDMALMSLLAGLGLRRPMVLEIGDIREIQVRRGMIGRMVRWIDAQVAGACSLLVSTASGFIDGYYRQKLGTRTPALIIENKLEPTTAIELPRSDDDAPTTSHLRIGYFGVLRCQWSWEVLTTLAAAHTSIEIVAAGIALSPKDIAEQALTAPNIRYLGAYRSPQDLESLYSQVDIVWACYPSPGGTDAWRWAQKICRSNRFYECCAYRTPIISLQGSGDGDVVSVLDIGLVIPSKATEETVETIAQINDQDLRRWKANAVRLPRSTYEYTSEGSELSALIRDLLD